MQFLNPPQALLGFGRVLHSSEYQTIKRLALGEVAQLNMATIRQGVISSKGEMFGSVAALVMSHSQNLHRFPLSVPPTQTELAELLGTTQASVCKFLQKDYPVNWSCYKALFVDRKPGRGIN